MKTPDPRMSAQTLKLIGALMATPGHGLSGVEISRETGLASGTVYPILFRLEQAGWLVGQWETDDANALGRPRRRYYRMTGVGATKARAVFRELGAVFGRVAWA
jgi:PadR family transcriptional regulator PadR